MMEGSDIVAAEAIIDNGRFGKRTVRFETGRLAKQAAGSALAYLDDSTTVLSATTVGKNPKDQFDFFPLTVDVEERQYAAGRIPGSFFRREAARAPRPSWPPASSTARCAPASSRACATEVQVVETVLTIDPDDAYDVLAINAASMSTQTLACRSPARSAAPAWRSSTTSGSRSRAGASSSVPCSTSLSRAASSPRKTAPKTSRS